MRIFQLLPVLAFGDAVGNDTRALKDALVEASYETQIYADVVDSRLPKGTALRFDLMPKLEPEDILIYHLSTGHSLNKKFESYQCRKVIIYHNITPEKYFFGYNRDAWINCKNGIKSVRTMRTFADFCFADSEYNKQELINCGYTCQIEVLPILIPFDDYNNEPDKTTMNKFGDGKTNILFTGRIVPNKKQEDVILSFYYYHTYLNINSRLILAGSFTGMEQYKRQLEEYTKLLGIEKDVFFSGMSSFEEILAYYMVSDLFLCMSEHEGFCVPLVEAMVFDKPIIARNTTAVSETLGDSGILLNDNDPIVAAEMIHRILSDGELQNTIIQSERIRLNDFDNVKIKSQFITAIQKLLESKL